jgi:hypothetical protein
MVKDNIIADLKHHEQDDSADCQGRQVLTVNAMVDAEEISVGPRGD